MDLLELKKYLNLKPGTTEEIPFGPDAIVFKVMGKMFALIGINNDPVRISIKLKPEYGMLMREEYPGINPAYHMNKLHWSMIDLDDRISDDKLLELIDESYNLVVKGLTKANKLKLLELGV